jgi:4-deoxy-L-threo-5-hexosulose-uronate ketol-isomerase
MKGTGTPGYIGINHKGGNFNMDIRYSTSPHDVKRYTTEELRKEFLIQNLYQPDSVQAVYSHVDRMVTLGIMPVDEIVPMDKGIDIWHSFGTGYFLERREAGFFNLGGSGVCTVDGTAYPLGHKDCIYITQGVRSVTFASDDAQQPAKFYGVSAPAHRPYETRLIRLADAAKKPLGAAETANKRVINQFIHPDVLKTCQLSMGMTVLDEGSVWNTMPVHTHERRMEIYTYFDIPDGNVVFHLMGRPDETRHIVMKNFDAVISPSWSIHAGCGTGSYAFIWAMGGENQAFDDMDAVPTVEVR